MRNSNATKQKPATDTIALLNRLLDDHEAGLKLSAAAATMRKSRCTGILFGQPAPKFLRMGKTIRYKESDLQAWLDQFPTFANTAEAKQAANDSQVKGAK